MSYNKIISNKLKAILHLLTVSIRNKTKREKIYNINSLYKGNSDNHTISYKIEGQIKSFPDKKKLKEFLITKILLYQILKQLKKK